MTLTLFVLIACLASHLIYRRAYIHGYKHGMSISLTLFKSKLPIETFRSIATERVAQIDALLGAKR